MKNTITLFLFTITIGLSLANAQDVVISYIPENTSPDPNNPTAFIVNQSEREEGEFCCEIDLSNPANTDISCCDVGSTWNLNTTGIEQTEYIRYKITARWTGRSTLLNTDPDETWSKNAGITIRSSVFDDILFTTPTTGGIANSTETPITFEGDFPVPYNPNNGDLQIDFFHYFQGLQALWSDVQIKLYKPTDCDRPTVINDIELTSRRYDFEWTPAVNNNANQYYWQITPFSLTPLDDDCPVDSGTTAPGETAASSNKLMPGNPYILKIQSICDNESKSIFKDKIFRTIKDGTPPLNDDIANAIPVQNNCFYTGSTSEATIDQENAQSTTTIRGPASTPNINVNNVWYSYTGSGNFEDVFLDLCKSANSFNFPFENLPLDDYYNADINVYRGTPGNLELVQYYNSGLNGCEDEEGLGILNPKLSFRSDGTSTYYISIDGIGSESGYFRLDVSITPSSDSPPPSNDECSGAIELTAGITKQADLINATQSISVDIDTPCEDFEDWKDVWFKYTLNETSNLTLELQESGNKIKSIFALYSSNQQGCASWDTRIPIFQAYLELPEGDIDEIEDKEFCENKPEKTFTYRCLPEGEYFIRVFTDNNENAGITATDEPSDGASANLGTLTADQSPVVLENGTSVISATLDAGTIVPTGYKLAHLVTGPNNTIINREINEISPSFTVDQTGTYTITTIVYDPFTLNIEDTLFGAPKTIAYFVDYMSNKCGVFDSTGTTIEVTDQTLSNDRINDYGFSFQPNPVNTTLSLNAKQPINKVVLYTIQGQRVRSTNPNTMHSEIDMSGLANGLYFIEVSINNTIQAARIIKQ